MSLKNAVHTSLAAVALTLTASMPGHAEQMRAIHFSGSWQGGSYSNDQTKKFSHCTGGATYRSGIMLMVTINRQYNWGLGFVDQNWNLTVGQNIPVSVTFDGGAPWNGTALVITRNMVTIPMAE